MKKTLLVTSLTVVTILCLTMFSGCFQMWNNGARIAFEEKPANTFYVGDGIEQLSFSIKDLDEKEVVAAFTNGVASTESLVVTGFDTTEVGKGKLIVSYGGYFLEFSYSVIAKA